LPGRATSHPCLGGRRGHSGGVIALYEGERRLVEAEASLAEIDAADIVAEELALERAQSARALIEAVDGLLTGGR
jgi:hypothetical protein